MLGGVGVITGVLGGGGDYRCVGGDFRCVGVIVGMLGKGCVGEGVWEAGVLGVIVGVLRKGCVGEGCTSV